MKKKTMNGKGLSLSRETLRRLTTEELAIPAGGLGKASVNITCTPSVDKSCDADPAA